MEKCTYFQRVGEVSSTCLVKDGCFIPSMSRNEGERRRPMNAGVQDGLNRPTKQAKNRKQRELKGTSTNSMKKREKKQRSAASTVRDKELNCLITNFYIKRGDICTRVCYISTDSLNFSRAVGSLCGY